MRVAAVDVGTNTVLLLLADVDEAGTISPLAYEQRTPRLGKDVDAQKVIGQPAFERVGAVLAEYKKIAEVHNVDTIIACGTSAVREAVNQAEFIGFIQERTGIVLEVLDPEEEAICAYRGALSGLGDVNGKFAVIDIGGGSTEITIGSGMQVQTSMSMSMGSVRLTERFLRHEPPLLSELTFAHEYVQRWLNALEADMIANASIVAVAGTATTLAALDQKLEQFELEKIKNYKLTTKSIDELYFRLRSMTSNEIRSLSAVTEGRADILTAGSLILHEFMRTCGAEFCIVSERGVRFGLVLREWERVHRASTRR